MFVRMRMDLEMTRRRLELCDEEKRQITSERDAVIDTFNILIFLNSKTIHSLLAHLAAVENTTCRL